MGRAARGRLAILLALASFACASRGAGSGAGEGWVRQELWFGAEIPTGGEVTDAAWASFVAEEVAPRFPAGFSVLDASGHWRHPDGRQVRERTRVLVILHEAGDVVAERALDDIAVAYVARFRQDAVLRTRDRLEVEIVEP